MEDTTKHEKDIPTVEAHVDYVSEQVNQAPSFKFTWIVILNLAALYLTSFSSTWANSLPTSSYSFIVREFPTEQRSLIWITVLPGLALVLVQNTAGPLSDHLGRRSFVIAGMLIGAVGLFLGGFATTAPMVIGGQALNSIGMSLGYLSTPFLAEIVPKEQRGIIIGIQVTLTGIISLAGTVANGAWCKNDVGGPGRGWRVAWYMGAGWYLASAIFLLIFYRPVRTPSPEGYTRTQILRKFDYIGSFLTCSGTVLFTVGLNLGGAQYPWKSAAIISFLVIGGVLLVALGLWEWKGTNTGLLHHGLFKDRNFAITLGLNFVEGIMAFGGMGYLTAMILYLFTSDPFMAVVYGLPSGAGTMLGAFFAGFILKKYKRVSAGIYFCLTLFIVACGVLAGVRPHAGYVWLFFPCIFFGFLLGGLGVAIPVIATICTPNDLIASAVATGSALRGLGGIIGSVCFAQIFGTKVATYLPTKIAEAVVPLGLPISSLEPLLTALISHHGSGLADVPGVTPEILAAAGEAMLEAYADAFKFVWVALIPFAAVTMASIPFLNSIRPMLTKDLAREVEDRVHIRHHHEHEQEHKKEIEP